MRAVLRVQFDGQDVVLSAADLASLRRRELRILTEDSSDSASVSGVALWDVIQKAGVPPRQASGRQRATMTVQLRGADGQTAVFALVEIDPGFSRREVLVADKRNGKPLDAVEGPWRVFAPDELRHARWIRGLVSIKVEAMKPTKSPR